MKKLLTATTRWEYYVANIAGLVALVVAIGWSGYRTITNSQGFTLTSFSIWIALICLGILPFAIISFFSSMKTVVVTQKALIISYVFQKHENNIPFSEVKTINSNRKPNEKAAGPAALSDSFSILLNDGRQFSFTRSQFAQYNKLKELVYQSVKR